MYSSFCQITRENRLQIGAGNHPEPEMLQTVNILRSGVHSLLKWTIMANVERDCIPSERYRVTNLLIQFIKTNQKEKRKKESDEIEVITSCVFGDPFDIVGNALDVEVIVVELRALLLAEIGASGRTRLNVARPVEDVRFSVGQIAEYSGATAGIIKLQFH